MLATLRNVSAGMNLPYELLVKDFSKTNYSSARAALLEAWRYFNGRRRWLSDYWLREVYALWLEEAVNAGEIEAPGFYDNKYAYCRAKFIFGGRGWVDPVKDATASRMRVEGFVSTLEQECAEQGLDLEEVLDQRQIEAAMMRERGLSMPAMNGQNQHTGAGGNASNSNGDDNEEDNSDEQADPVPAQEANEP
jgi:lambda family phage portal protein